MRTCRKAIIIITHDDGSQAMYWHPQKMAPRCPGDRVEIGQLIGYSGNTSYSAHFHLHFQVYMIKTASEYRHEVLRPQKCRSTCDPVNGISVRNERKKRID